MELFFRQIAASTNVDLVDEDDFDLLSPEYTFQRNTKLTNPKKSLAKIRPQTKRPRSNRNPVKSLMERTADQTVDAQPAVEDSQEEEEPTSAGLAVSNGQKKSTVTGLAEKSECRSTMYHNGGCGFCLVRSSNFSKKICKFGHNF